MMAIFDGYNIGSADWNYKSGRFGLVKGDGSVNQDIVENITNSKK